MPAKQISNKKELLARIQNLSLSLFSILPVSAEETAEIYQCLTQITNQLQEAK